jgi:hypothetical protein
MADPADLESLAARLEQSGDYRILRRVPVVARYAEDDPCRPNLRGRGSAVQWRNHFQAPTVIEQRNT